MAQQLKVRLNGVSPLLMHSSAGVNPTHPIVLQIKKLTSKRAKDKTEDDLLKLMDLEFQLNGYFDEEIGPYIPADMIEAALREGAKKSRKGKSVQAAVVVEPDRIPLLYDGPRTVEELLKHPEFRDVRSVVVNRSRTLRCRPRFNHWALEFVINYLPSVIDKDALIDALVIAGQQCALGDYRPRYGRFQVEILD